MFSKKLAAVAALSMITASSAAVAQSAAPQSISARAGETAQDSNELVGTTAWILAAIALGLIVWGVVELTSDSDSP